MNRLKKTRSKEIEQIHDFYQNFDFKSMVNHPPREMRTYRELELKFLEKYFPANVSILEIGCGYGRILKHIAGKGRSIVGIDFCVNQIENAKKIVSDQEDITLRVMDAEKLDFGDNSFDYVCCMYQTLGNMPRIEKQVVQEMLRVCKERGEVLISVFSDKIYSAQIENYNRLNMTNIRNEGSAIITDEGFYSRRFKKKDLEELFIGYNVFIQSLSEYGWLLKVTK